ncbi:hypothetical protein [Cytobacillus firmus]
MEMKGLKMSNHHFSLLVFMLIKKHFPQNHYKCINKFKWVIYKDGDYYGVLILYSYKTIKIFYKGKCIQYFTRLFDLGNWMKNGCSKETLQQ